MNSRTSPVASPNPSDTDHKCDEVNGQSYEALILCMKLVTVSAHSYEFKSGAVDDSYQNAKRLVASALLLPDPSIEWLQAGLLLALFEFGQWDSKLAYHRLSEIVRLAQIAGIEPGKYSAESLAEVLTVDNEDRRALWWGMFILDQ